MDQDKNLQVRETAIWAKIVVTMAKIIVGEINPVAYYRGEYDGTFERREILGELRSPVKRKVD